MKSVVAVIGALLIITAGTNVWSQIECTDNVYAVVDGDLIRVIHQGATYNCCPEFEYAVYIEFGSIHVFEMETLQQCYCICCMDLDVDISGVPPGEYLLEFHWFDYETDQWMTWPLEVVVPDSGATLSDPYIADYRHSDCYDYTPVPEEDTSTWSTIKALYR